ncbi:MAG: thiolase family protein, partial [Desulfobacula sp.]|nr:thiolase family protein [Desulfobacula sp.]
MFTKAYIPYKGYYSSPFSKWQGSFANEHSIVLGSKTAKNWLASRDISPDIFDYLILGATVGQPHIF